MRTQQLDTDGSASRLLGCQEAATYLGITPRSLARLVAGGLLTPVRLPGLRRTLFDRQNLEDLIDLERASDPGNRQDAAGWEGVEEPDGEGWR